MMRYLTEARDQMFVKGYEVLSFAKNMGKNLGKNICENLSRKYNHKRLDNAKKYATDAMKTA